MLGLMPCLKVIGRKQITQMFWSIYYIHCKKGYQFSSPQQGCQLCTKLSLASNNSITPGQEEFGQRHPCWGREIANLFYSVSYLCFCSQKKSNTTVFFFILQVYKTQLTRISESWDDKVADMEKVNLHIFCNVPYPVSIVSIPITWWKYQYQEYINSISYCYCITYV